MFEFIDTCITEVLINIGISEKAIPNNRTIVSFILDFILDFRFFFFFLDFIPMSCINIWYKESLSPSGIMRVTDSFVVKYPLFLMVIDPCIKLTNT